MVLGPEDTLGAKASPPPRTSGKISAPSPVSPTQPGPSRTALPSGDLTTAPTPRPPYSHSSPGPVTGTQHAFWKGHLRTSPALCGGSGEQGGRVRTCFWGSCFLASGLPPLAEAEARGVSLASTRLTAALHKVIFRSVSGGPSHVPWSSQRLAEGRGWRTGSGAEGAGSPGPRPLCHRPGHS